MVTRRRQSRALNNHPSGCSSTWHDWLSNFAVEKPKLLTRRHKVGELRRPVPPETPSLGRLHPSSKPANILKQKYTERLMCERLTINLYSKNPATILELSFGLDPFRRSCVRNVKARSQERVFPVCLPNHTGG